MRLQVAKILLQNTHILVKVI